MSVERIVTCLNNGIYVKRISRSIHREFSDKTFITLAFALYCEISLLLYFPQRKSGRDNKENLAVL